MADVTVRRGDAHDLDLLEPLWVAVHHQHRACMPHLGPYVDDEVTWRHRRDLYNSLFERYDPCLLLAMDGGRPIGYGLAYAMPAHDTWLADTWTTGTLIGEVESLSVLPEHRGLGIGARLLTELHHHLRDAGVRDVIIGVLPGNTDAQRLYTRHDYTPTWMYLSRLEGRGRSDDRAITEISAGPVADAAVRSFLEAHNADRVARRGQLVDVVARPTIVARQNGEVRGVLAYDIVDDACEVLTLHCTTSWSGLGTRLLEALVVTARERGCRRLWLVTTNDNVDALRFYQRRGFQLTALRTDAVQESRRALKPTIPRTGSYGISLRDELELSRTI